MNLEQFFKLKFNLEQDIHIFVLCDFPKAKTSLDY